MTNKFLAFKEEKNTSMQRTLFLSINLAHAEYMRIRLKQKSKASLAI